MEIGLKTSSHRRIFKEIKQVYERLLGGVVFDLLYDDFSTLTGVIIGPLATPFEGGVFRFSV